MVLKRIHVRRDNITANRKHGANKPVISVKFGDENHCGSACDITGPSRVVYRPEKPLKCGAVLWIETTEPVYLDGKDVEEGRCSRG
jgi:hypothetical protein